MGQDPEDVRPGLGGLLLAALAVTAAQIGGPGPHDLAYRRGFAAALGAMAVAIHSHPAALAELATRNGARVIWPELEAQP
jgi:hypothetical protein